MRPQIYILGILFPIIFLSNHVYADSADPYGIQNNRFASNPIVCVLEPGGEHFSFFQTRPIMEESKRGIYEWVTLLQEKSIDKSKWSISYIEIPDNERKPFDFSSCNVIVNFKNDANKKTANNLGTHHYVDGTSYITIFYKTSECKQNTKASCKNSNADLITKIGSTIRHEFGHALGLGHYESDKQKNKEWFENPQTAPSIMLEYSKGTLQERVTSNDIDKVIEIYKDSGFTDQHLPKIRNTQLLALTQITPTELFISDSIVKAAKEINHVTISGKFKQVNGILGTVDITILRPDSKIEKTKIPVDKNGFFEYEYEVHSKLPKGIYYVQAQHGKNTTEKNTFEVH